jgi:DNA-binding GntR family transcriptional regulator
MHAILSWSTHSVPKLVSFRINCMQSELLKHPHRQRDARAGLPRGHATLDAADRLRDMIVEGALAPATRISERMIQERFGISRTPLREAFKVLAAEGLITLAPNRGAVVTRLSFDELQAAFELLSALDGAAGELACERATDHEIDAVYGLHQLMVAHHNASDLHQYFHVNKAIHLAIVDAAHNEAISRVYRAEAARIDRYRYAGNRTATHWARAIREHDHILDAFRHRQGAVLREVLFAHRRTGWSMAKAMFERENA